MNALQEVSQTPILDWSAHETGLRAYGRVRNERISTLDSLQPQRSPFFEEIDARITEAVEKHRTDLSEIRKSFVFRDEQAVISFLRTHRTIPILLSDALPELAKSFGKDVVFALKVLTEEDGSREMYVVAEWGGPAEEAMKALDHFIDDWWIDRSGPAAGRLSVTYELN